MFTRWRIFVHMFRSTNGVGIVEKKTLQITFFRFPNVIIKVGDWTSGKFSFYRVRIGSGVHFMWKPNDQGLSLIQSIRSHSSQDSIIFFSIIYIILTNIVICQINSGEMKWFHSPIDTSRQLFRNGPKNWSSARQTAYYSYSSVRDENPSVK